MPSSAASEKKGPYLTENRKKAPFLTRREKRLKKIGANFNHDFEVSYHNKEGEKKVTLFPRKNWRSRERGIKEQSTTGRGVAPFIWKRERHLMGIHE